MKKQEFKNLSVANAKAVLYSAHEAAEYYTAKHPDSDSGYYRMLGFIQSSVGRGFSPSTRAELEIFVSRLMDKEEG